MKNVYTPDWFKERAFGSLKKMNDGNWDYSDSLLLYTPGTESEYESIQKGEDPYSKLVTTPERKFLKEISKNIVEELPDHFEYIDLGPGTAHKEQFIFDAAKEQNKTFRYIPVDISKYYLKLASEYAKAHGVETILPIQSAFEDLVSKLEKSSTPRFVSLGLTFTNYLPQEILNLLCKIVGENGYIFVGVQLRERVDMKEIVNVYSSDVRALTDAKLYLIDLDPDKDISSCNTDDGVRIWCTVKNSNPKLKQKGITSGDKLLMLRSLRYTKELLGKEIKAISRPYTLLDTGSSFIGALIKPQKD